MKLLTAGIALMLIVTTVGDIANSTQNTQYVVGQNEWVAVAADCGVGTSGLLEVCFPGKRWLSYESEYLIKAELPFSFAYLCGT